MKVNSDLRRAGNRNDEAIISTQDGTARYDGFGIAVEDMETLNKKTNVPLLELPKMRNY